MPATPNVTVGLKRLRSYLISRAGAEADAQEIIKILQPVWSELPGSSAGKMEAFKLARLGRPTWAPPNLEFEIERHGGMEFGSKRARRQGWTLNLETGELASFDKGFNQIIPNNRPLKVTPLVARVIEAIRSKSTSDPAVKWRSVDRVELDVEQLVPSGEVPKQTLQGRRKRFRTELSAAMNAVGWSATGRPYVFTSTRPQDGPEA